MGSDITEEKKEFKSKYTKSQRIFAICGVVLLLLLYVVTFISAFLTTPATPTLFRACLLASFLIPLMIFAYIKVGRLLSGR